jgi:aryl-alcohol dehydrogenase-like predicted oxidoreductase
MAFMSANVSKIVLGTDWMGAFPNSARWNLWPVRKAEKILEASVELGINAFDTARLYASERILGRFLRSHRSKRADFKIISKGGHPGFFIKRPLTRQNLYSDLEKSLRALDTDYIDIYLFHYDDPSVPVNAMVEWSQDLLRSGKIRQIGYSNIALSRLTSIYSSLSSDHIVPWVSNKFCVLDDEKDKGGRKQVISQNSAYIEFLRHNQLPFLAYSPLGRGAFRKSEKPPDPKANLLEKIGKTYGVPAAVIALNCVLQTSPYFHAVIGTSNLEHLKTNVQAVSLQINESEYTSLMGAAAGVFN